MIPNNMLEICEIFENTTNLKLSCLDSKFNVIINNNNFDLTKIYSKAKFNNMNKIDISYLSLGKNKEIIVIFVDSKYQLNNFFIIGPYLRDCNSKIDLIKNSLIPKKSEQALKYSIDIFFSILSDFNQNTNYISNAKNLHIRKALDFIEHNYNEEISIDLVCKNLNLHKCYFCTLFKKETNLTFSKYINKIRIEKSKELLKSSSFSILDIAIEVGFNNQNYFSMAFKSETGISPIQYRKNT